MTNNITTKQAPGGIVSSEDSVRNVSSSSNPGTQESDSVRSKSNMSNSEYEKLYPAESGKKASAEDISPVKQEKKTDSNQSEESTSREHISTVVRRIRTLEDKFSRESKEVMFEEMIKPILVLLCGVKERINADCNDQFGTHFREIFKDLSKCLSSSYRFFGKMLDPRSYVGFKAHGLLFQIINMRITIESFDHHKHIAAIRKIVDTKYIDDPTQIDEVSGIFSTLNLTIDEVYEFITGFTNLVFTRIARDELFSNKDIEYLVWFREELYRGYKTLEKLGLAEETEELHRG